MTPPVEQELARQRAALQAIEQQRTAEILRTYTTVAARMAVNLKALMDLIEAETAKGVEVRPGWLIGQERYNRLISDLAEHTETFLAETAQTVTDGQRDAVQHAIANGQRLVQAALKPAPRDLLIEITDRWDRLPAAALDAFIGRAQDGGALGDLLHELSPLAPRKVKDTLAFGVAAGKHPRVIAREVQAAAQVTPNRALVIARTEIVQAHRQATTQTWKATGIVPMWEWRCARDSRTCAACWAMDGTEHPADEEMGSHPQCRCGRIPVPLSWAQLGYPNMPDRPAAASAVSVFDHMTDGEKARVLGRARLDAYNNGDITLADLVRPTSSRRWGPGIRVATIDEALA